MSKRGKPLSERGLPMSKSGKAQYQVRMGATTFRTLPQTPNKEKALDGPFFVLLSS